MMRMVSGLIAAVFLVTGCSEASPCSNLCPKMEGTYAMTYKAPTVTTVDCGAVPVPDAPATIAITRSGAEVRSVFNGTTARGMLQETNDFSIAGADRPEDGGTTQEYTLRGYYVPGKSGAKGTIEGKWITRGEKGSKSCDVERPASGVQQ